MAIITSKTLIISISLFHIALGVIFITNPQRIPDQILVQVLGQSMGIPHARGFDAQSHSLAFLGAVLALLGLSDLVSFSMPEELGALYYWGTQAPLRALFAILVTSYIYAFGPSSPLYGGATHLTRGGQNPSYHPARWGGDALKNRIFFSFVFVEMMAWFWVWVTLREERPGVVERMRRNTRRESAKQREE
ncbi:hypothetical protein E4U17_001353 [Claviceps sp. LM77 group G4]|nr:hypothetical protein E4U17_001353 [Claviceps sp. LM77 group G4]KAG6066673.1 hypothetical protein E4U33_005527 [Claviceps sp. LM78 group G4]KAG6073661.1 hypothetical protein E4U16_004548 [Claviceps sp. LM84 group G4]